MTDMPRPGPSSDELGGVGARARVVETHTYIAEADTPVWAKMSVTVLVDGGSPVRLDCWLSEEGHRLLHSARTVPVRVDPSSGAVLGVDVDLYEAEAAAHLADQSSRSRRVQ
jgi:hypothetical protein